MANVTSTIEKIYENTVKFTCNNEHNEQEVLDMLTYRGMQNRIWGINLTNRGKMVEIKLGHQNDNTKLIQTGIYDEKNNCTFIVEPAFDTNKTIITVFNVPLGESGSCIQQYLEENNLKVLSRERQNVKYGDFSVYTGVIKYRCNKLNGFEILPTFKTFYNNRKVGIRHAEQYEQKNMVEQERNKVAKEKKRMEEEDNERRRELKIIEAQNAERNRQNRELRERIVREKKEEEQAEKEKVEQKKKKKE